MTMFDFHIWFLPLLVYAAAFALAVPIGLYMARVFDGRGPRLSARRDGFAGSNRGWTPARRTGSSMRWRS